MAALSDFLEQAIISHLFRGTALFSVPASVFVALYTSPTDDAGGGTEVTGGSYARVAVSTAGGWSAPGAAGLTDNLALITFPTASASWGTITHVAIRDAASGGNLYLHGQLAQPRTILNGDTFKFAIGELNVTFA